MDNLKLHRKCITLPWISCCYYYYLRTSWAKFRLHYVLLVSTQTTISDGKVTCSSNGTLGAKGKQIPTSNQDFLLLGLTIHELHSTVQENASEKLRSKCPLSIWGGSCPRDNLALSQSTVRCCCKSTKLILGNPTLPRCSIPLTAHKRIYIRIAKITDLPIYW